MCKRAGTAFLIALILSAFFVLPATTEIALAQKASVPKTQDKVALGEAEVKQLLLLMDTDKNGKISKQEFMTFMDAEFKRLDKNKDGELDVKELTQSKLRTRSPSSVERK
jgi:hypothetical protein